MAKIESIDGLPVQVFQFEFPASERHVYRFQLVATADETNRFLSLDHNSYRAPIRIGPKHKFNALRRITPLAGE